MAMKFEQSADMIGEQIHSRHKSQVKYNGCIHYNVHGNTDSIFSFVCLIWA